jgi:hypothetical protein
MNKQETWVEKRQIKNGKDSHKVPNYVTAFSFFISRNKKLLRPTQSPLISLCACAVVHPKTNLSLFLVKILLLFSFLPTASTYKIQKQQIYFLFYNFILLWGYFISWNWSVSIPHQSRVITDRTLLLFTFGLQIWFIIFLLQ